LNRTYQFNRLQKIAEHVKLISKGQVLRFFDKYIAPSAPCRRKLCVQVFAKQHENLMDQAVDDEKTVVIKDLVEFKRNMPLFQLDKQVEVSVVEPKA
jgi:secreted Zn-dependent insulinase-like peptidase